MVLTVSFVLSPVTGLFCHRHRRNCLRQLDASVGASGPHDFAVREPASLVCAPPRPPHPVPYVRDDRETPLCLGRDDSLYSCFYQTGKRKILREGTGHPNCRTARRANHAGSICATDPRKALHVRYSALFSSGKWGMTRFEFRGLSPPNRVCN